MANESNDDAGHGRTGAASGDEDDEVNWHEPSDGELSSIAVLLDIFCIRASSSSDSK